MITVATQTHNGHRIATALHDAGSKDIVIFCHGYRGTSVGPNRFFVRAARQLEQAGISSLRFDQAGSGNSDGDFYDSSFNDWVATAQAIARHYLHQGFRVALWGQSMGASASICVAAASPELTALVAWVPDPNVDTLQLPATGYFEEAGQRVQTSFWQQAHSAGIPAKLAATKVPAHIVQCTSDEYVNAANRAAITQAAQPHHAVQTFDGYTHSTWTYDQAQDIITRSAQFLIDRFQTKQ